MSALLHIADHKSDIVEVRRVPRTDIDASNPPAICRAINMNKAEDVPKALVRFINR
jgi:hypothetical protein